MKSIRVGRPPFMQRTWLWFSVRFFHRFSFLVVVVANHNILFFASSVSERQHGINIRFQFQFGSFLPQLSVRMSDAVQKVSSDIICSRQSHIFNGIIDSLLLNRTARYSRCGSRFSAFYVAMERTKYAKCLFTFHKKNIIECACSESDTTDKTTSSTSLSNSLHIVIYIGTFAYMNRLSYLFI